MLWKMWAAGWVKALDPFAPTGGEHFSTTTHKLNRSAVPLPLVGQERGKGEGVRG